VLVPAADMRLVAGETVVVRWSQLPASAEEMELLLTLDDGSRTTIRLTQQLAPDTDSHLWVVPFLPSHGARIRLRFGAGGSEVETAPSAPFAISAGGASGVAALTWAAGEWWLGGVAVAEPGSRSPREAAVELPAGHNEPEQAADDGSTGHALTVDLGAVDRFGGCRLARLSDPPTPPRSRRPQATPQRE
jgi:hypothetical protein